MIFNCSYFIKLLINYFHSRNKWFKRINKKLDVSFLYIIIHQYYLTVKYVVPPWALPSDHTLVSSPLHFLLLVLASLIHPGSSYWRAFYTQSPYLDSVISLFRGEFLVCYIKHVNKYTTIQRAIYISVLRVDDRELLVLL